MTPYGYVYQIRNAPGAKERKAEANRRNWRVPEARASRLAKMRMRARAKWEDPAWRAMQLAAHGTTEAREKVAEANRRRWAVPGAKESWVAKMRAIREQKKAAN